MYSQPASDRAVASIQLIDAVNAMRKAQEIYANSDYPQVAASISLHVHALEKLADESVALQLRQVVRSYAALQDLRNHKAMHR